MKRFWIGAALLLGLLAAGIWSMTAMDSVHSAISDDLRASAQAAQPRRCMQQSACPAFPAHMPRCA